MKSCLIVLSAALFSQATMAGGLSADFSVEKRPFRRALHSSGFAPRIYSAGDTFNQVKSLKFDYTRTHDWALVNDGQRIIDSHFIFPLMHLDHTDPKNYYFKPTDFILKRAQEAGMKIFYRLGTSIEHTGKVHHFNTLIPEDFDKVAEVFAATVRHYTKGWADGFNWDIKYWEIWNEPDISNAMWCLPEGDEGPGRFGKRQKLFIKFFVTCLKRLKSEFPELKIGGPAMSSYSEAYFKLILAECKKEGVAPDFISWHYYGDRPLCMTDAADAARKMLDDFGFTKCELILNEWHYLGKYSWRGLRNSDPQVVKKVWEGPASHNGIESSAFTLTSLAMFQTSKLDQAYFYGCRHTGAWGYMDQYQQKYKIWYALKLFGDLSEKAATVCDSTSADTVTLLAVKSADRKTGWLLVSDYRGKGMEVPVTVKGAGKVVSATLLDYERNNEPVDVTLENGVMKLKKKIPGSAAFLITFTTVR